MPIQVYRGESDEVIDQIVSALKPYESAHPAAQIDVYRQNSVSIRIRIIDPAFKGIPKSQRHEIVWEHLESLSDETASDISMLVLVTPVECHKSLGNLEFEDPVPSIL